VPLAVGLKAIFTLQLAPAARLVPHVLLAMMKSPVLAMDEIVNMELPLFVTVITLARLVVSNV
jgi:hypothetical protein